MEANRHLFYDEDNYLTIDGCKDGINLSHSFLSLLRCTPSSIDNDINIFKANILSVVIPRLRKYNIDCVRVQYVTHNIGYTKFIYQSPTSEPEVFIQPEWWDHKWYVSQDINYHNILRAIDDIITYAVTHKPLHSFDKKPLHSFNKKPKLNILSN